MEDRQDRPGLMSVSPPIVGISASSDNLDSISHFLSLMPVDSGLVYIVAAQLSLRSEGLFRSLLAKFTSMPVVSALDNFSPTPDQICLITQRSRVTLIDGKFQAESSVDESIDGDFIDRFFTSLAKNQNSNVACILLSGVDGDGANAILADKKRFGLVLAKANKISPNINVDSIDSIDSIDSVDFVVPINEMPNKLFSYFSLSTLTEKNTLRLTYKSIARILDLLIRHTGTDFRRYKLSTVVRRIDRRMGISQLASIEEYVKVLEASLPACELLKRDLLIGVSTFFRDALAFDFLGAQLSELLVVDHPKDKTVRVWVPACSTGEEAYSLAIELSDWKTHTDSDISVQIFATDLNPDSIEIARRGIYGSEIQSLMSNQRFQNYFEDLKDGKVVVKSAIRKMVVFAEHDIINDPPFTHLHILSCRNLLIYMQPDLQRDLIPAFHYSLKKGGLLFLGSSEAIGASSHLFDTVEKKWKIFRRRFDSINSTRSFNRSSTTISQPGIKTIRTEDTQTDNDALLLAKTILQESEVKPSIVVNGNLDVLYVYGRTGVLLEPGEGQNNYNLRFMLKLEHRAVVLRAIDELGKGDSDELEIQLSASSSSNLDFWKLTLRKITLSDQSSRVVMLVLDAISPVVDTIGPIDHQQLEKLSQYTAEELRAELIDSWEQLQNIHHELELKNQELRSSSEEMQSSNEELQSAVEELGTSKEELQSLNEESASVNFEQQMRIDSLSNSNDDLQNFLDSTESAIIFLDVDLNIRRFTPKITDIVPVNQSDIGRPLRHLATNLLDVDLAEASTIALKTLGIQEFQARSSNQRVYQTKVHPYRTASNVIDGVVLTFTDITEQSSVSQLKFQYDSIYRALFLNSEDPKVVVSSKDFKFFDANEAACRELGYTREEFLELDLSDIAADRSIEEIRIRADSVLADGPKEFETRHLCKDGEIKKVRVVLKTIYNSHNPVFLATWNFI